MKLPAVLFLIFLAGSMTSCKKDSFITNKDAAVIISADTIHFDTLFTTTGSVTQFFKIFNNNDRRLKVSDITLSGGSASLFTINADGTPGPSVTNLEIEANDSLYVFVTVNIDPTNADLPFVVEDSIGITYNGNQKWVQLQAWGQNATFLNAKVIVTDTTWTNKKPFVILGGLLVAEGVELKIEQGTKIYLLQGARTNINSILVREVQKYKAH